METQRILTENSLGGGSAAGTATPLRGFGPPAPRRPRILAKTEERAAPHRAWIRHPCFRGRCRVQTESGKASTFAGSPWRNCFRRNSSTKITVKCYENATNFDRKFARRGKRRGNGDTSAGSWPPSAPLPPSPSENQGKGAPHRARD